MNPAHADVRANAAAYVLGTLDPDEKDSFESHLCTCGECRAEVQSLRQATNVLAYAVPQRTPPPDLRRRVLKTFPPARSQAAESSSPAVRPMVWTWLPIAASLMFTDLQSSMAVLSAPDLVRIDLTGQETAPQSSGRAMWSRARGMVFATSSLPPAPAGKVYQLWVVTAQAPISAGLVVPDQNGGGMTYFYTPPDIVAPTAVAVTLEPAGGVPSPTGPFFLVGKAT